MELLYSMVLFLVMALIFSYYVFNKDVMSPQFLLCAGYLLSFLCAIYNFQTWNAEIGIYTIFLYMLGIMSFIAGGIYVKRVMTKRLNGAGISSVKFTEIKIDFIKYLFCVLVCAFILFMTYQEVVRIANLKYVSWANLAYNFKTNVGDASLEGSNLSTRVTQLNKVTKGFAFVFLFIFINNIFALKDSKLRKKIANLKYTVPVVIYILQNTIKGGRFTSIAMIIGAVFIYYFFWRLKVGWLREIKIKYILRVIAMVIAIFTVFWLSREMVGRRSADTSAVGYLTRYLGGGPYLFNMYLNDISYLQDGVHETFANMITSLNKLGLFNIPSRLSHEFRVAPSGIVIGNAHSALRNYYHDFGIIGVVVLNFLLAIIYGGVYNRMKAKITTPDKNIFTMILYSSMIYIIVFQFFSDYFFARLSNGFFIEVFVMWLCYLFLFNIKIRDNKIIFAKKVIYV